MIFPIDGFSAYQVKLCIGPGKFFYLTLCFFLMVCLYPLLQRVLTLDIGARRSKNDDLTRLRKWSRH